MNHADLKVIPSELGGGFGGKTVVYLEPLVVALSRKSGLPVKIVMSRIEVFQASGPTSDSIMKVKIGAKKDGTICGAEAKLWFGAGAFPGAPVIGAAMCAFSRYDLANVRAELLQRKEQLESTAKENERRTKHNTRIQVIQEQTNAFLLEAAEFQDVLIKQESLLLRC